MKLGDKVRDKVTGYEGIAIGKTEWLNGCTRWTVQSQTLHEGKPIDSFCFDEPQLEIVEVEPVKAGPKTTGGPIPSPQRRRDPVR